jgi:hypothetical protein
MVAARSPRSRATASKFGRRLAMFGFGMSAIDKVILAKTEQMLAAIGLSGELLKNSARRLFDETKAETKARHGDKLYSETIGDDFAAHTQFMATRRAAGLNEDDVRKHWNRCLLLVFIELKVRDMASFLVIRNAELMGRDPAEAARQYRSTTAIYGDPIKWDASKPANRGLTSGDADLYVEFAPRIEAWFARTSESERDVLLRKYSSFNAMVRNLVGRGQM